MKQGGTSYWGKCSGYENMKKEADSVAKGERKAEDVRLRIGSCSGSDGYTETFLEYATTREYTVKIRDAY
jgi:hypothetical protein